MFCYGFASVYGTGIVANAAVVLPLQVGLRVFATAVWGCGCRWRPSRPRALDAVSRGGPAHASNPAQFWGAPAMADDGGAGTSAGA